MEERDSALEHLCSGLAAPRRPRPYATPGIAQQFRTPGPRLFIWRAPKGSPRPPILLLAPPGPGVSTASSGGPET